MRLLVLATVTVAFAFSTFITAAEAKKPGQPNPQPPKCTPASSPGCSGK